MGYPVSYRHGAERYRGGGFQKPAPVEPDWADPMHPPYTPPPKPDNDPAPQRRPQRGPVGDPFRTHPDAWREKPEAFRHARFPRSRPYPGFPRGLGAFGRRPPGLPWQVDIAFDIVNAYMQYTANVNRMPVVEVSPEWVVRCGPSTPSGGYGGRMAFGKYDNNPGVCGLSGQALSGMTIGWPNVGPSDRGVLLAVSNEPNSVVRWYNIQQWHRNVGTGSASAKYPAMGPLVPAEVPATMPATVANPLPAIVEAPYGYEVPAARPFPAFVPRRPAAYAPPARANSPSGKLDPSAPGVVIIPDAPLPPRQPPGKGVKERKVTDMVGGGLAAALGAAGGVYEGAKFAIDIVNAFYNALPGKHTAKTPHDKLAELYRRYDEVDVNKAIEGVLKAVAYERAGAYIDRARRTASKNIGLHMHIQIPTGGGPRV